MRKVFLDELPKRGETMIDWTNSIDHNVRFIFDDIVGEFTISKYNKEIYRLTLTYNEKEYIISPSSFIRSSIKRIINKDINNIIQGNIVDTHPHLLKYFVNKEDAVNNTYGSERKVLFRCPDCGSEKLIRINYVTRFDKITCNNCGDGISYPEKFLTNLLKQLNINYKYQLGKLDVNWIKSNNRYDFGILDLSCIIETNGKQHYLDDCFKFKNARNLDEEKIKDMEKEYLAKENGIENYVILDCRKSELDWIKNSIMKSKLPFIFNFIEEDIDWIQCHTYALNNLVKLVCEYKNEHKKLTPDEIGKIFSITRGTVYKYLKMGKQVGWYTDEQNKKRTCSKMVEIFKNNISLGTFNSMTELENLSKNLLGIQLMSCGISKSCKDKDMIYKGFTFEYVA